MRWQTTVVIAILLALVAGFYFFDVEYLGPKREKVEQEKNRVWTFDPKDVEEVAFKRAQDTVRLRRAGDGWKMLEPVRTPGDRSTVDNTLSDFVTVKIDREVAATPASLGEFGLDKPAMEVTLRLKGRAAPVGLVLGAKSPTGAWIYAKRPDAPAVFAVPELLLRDGTQSASEFRDRTVLAFGRKEVTGLRIETGGETIDLEQAAPKKWRITRPEPLAADSDLVADFVDKLQRAKVKDFVAESPKSLAPYGLERPVRVEVRLGTEKDRATKALLFGRVDGEKKGVYAMRPGEPSVLLLDEAIWKQLPKNVAVLRDKTVVAFDRDRLSRIELESPKGTVTLVKAGDRWRITAPEALPADTALVSSLLFQLKEARAQAYLPDVRFTPTVRVSLWEGQAQTPTVLALAPSRETRGGQPSAYAEVAGHGPAVLVEARLLSDLSKSATDVRDHMLFSDLATTRVKRITVVRGARTAVLERSGDSQWRVVEPKRGAAKNGRVEDLLLTVAALRWNGMLGPAADPRKYGFDAPALQVSLFGDDGAEMAALTVGKREDGQVYVRTAAPTVYTVDTTRLGPLPKVPDDFQG